MLRLLQPPIIVTFIEYGITHGRNHAVYSGMPRWLPFIGTRLCHLFKKSSFPI